MGNEEYWVLLVDDDERVRRSVIRILSRIPGLSKPIEFDEAVDGDDGARLMHSREGRFPDLVISDYQMPNRNGLSLLWEFHECAPFVMMSATVDMDFMAAVEKTGVEFMEKPFDPEELLDVVQRALQRNFLT